MLADSFHGGDGRRPAKTSSPSSMQHATLCSLPSSRSGRGGEGEGKAEKMRGRGREIPAVGQHINHHPTSIIGPASK